MPIKNTATKVTIYAFDTDNNIGMTGQALTITVRGVGDGVEFTPSAPAITEVDSTNLKGVYSVSLTAGENNYDQVTIGGTCSTANVIIVPFSWANEQIDFTATQKASVNTEADTALSDINLDHLVKLAKDTSWTITVTKESIIDLITSKDTSQTFARATDSLEAKADDTGAGLTAIPTITAVTTVATVTNAVTTTSDTQIDNIEADTNELQGLISSGKLPAQIKGTDDIDFSATQKLSLNAATPASQADLIKIAGHSIIGTDTQVADAFEGMFNVSKPVFTTASVNQNADVKTVTDIISSSKIAASMDAMSDIDFSTKMKVSLNAATPISIGKVTGNVDGSVNSVTKTVDANLVSKTDIDFSAKEKTSLNASTPASIQGAVKSVTDAVTIASNSDITNIKAVTDKLDTALALDGAVYQYTINALENAPSGTGSSPEAIRKEIDANSTQLSAIVADTNEIQGLITSSKIAAQVKGIDDGVITAVSIATGAIDADALATDAVTEIIDAIKAMVVDGTITFQKAIKIQLARNAGSVIIDGNTFKYYDQSGALILTDPPTLAGSTRVIS